MKNDEILDKFGFLVVNNVYDEALKNFKALIDGTTKWGTGKEYTYLLNKLSSEDKAIFLKLHENTINTAIFSFLKIFEENTQFKIVYDDNEIQVDLNKISEMLKSEHIEWIKKYSEELVQ
jgi:hypothetical protein